MNKEDSDQYIIQKHILAIALAVIRTKPDDITFQTYINNINSKIKENNMEVDITICDDDFDISDDSHDDDDQFSHDSVTILKNFDLNDLNDPNEEKGDAYSLLNVMTELGNIQDNENNFTQSTNCDESQTPMNKVTYDTNETSDNLKTFCETQMESNYKVDNDLKNINSDKYNQATNEDVRDMAYCENNNLSETNKPNYHTTKSIKTNTYKDLTNKINIESKNIDSQQTVLYTLQGFTSNTHVSQSQEDVVIANKHLLNRSKALGNKVCNDNVNNSIQNTQNQLDGNMYLRVFNENNKTQNMYNEQDFHANIEKTKDTKDHFNNFVGNQFNILDKITISSNKDGLRKHKNLENDFNCDTKRVKIDGVEVKKINRSNRNTVEDLEIFSQNYDDNDFDKTGNNNTDTNLQTDNFTQEFIFRDHSNDFIYNIGHYQQNIDRTDTIKCKKTQLSPEFRFSTEESQSVHLTNESINIQLENTDIVNDYDIHIEEKQMNTHKNYNMNTTEINKNNNKQIYIEADANTMNFDDSLINLSQMVKNVKEKESKREELVTNGNEIEFQKMNSKDFPYNINSEMEAMTNLKETRRLKECILSKLPKEVISQQNIEEEFVSDDNTQMEILIENNFSENESDTQSEIVSFKTLEDLNTIKSYLNRREQRYNEATCSLDSGFKSSQPRSSLKSASQHSDLRINESAHSLLIFITDSQLSDKTAEIADEISRILGKLVDKLHEDEKYPKFLEELLDKVSALLKEVYEGLNEEFKASLKRDVTVYRILLLNKSTHIMQYTIEKINIILEKTCSEITEDIFELKDIEKAENICYIFHILEVLLKRVKKSNGAQMSVQNSEDHDRGFKRSTLTEMWRKKWNLSKNEICEGSAKKKCALTKCSDILNRIIVQAMDGYSLVSFAALQCFNLLQN